MTNEEFHQIRIAVTDQVRSAAAARGIAVEWVEVSYERSFRLDVDRPSTPPVDTEGWSVSAEVYGDNGFGAKRHRVLKASGRRHEQAIAKLVAAMEPVKVRRH